MSSTKAVTGAITWAIDEPPYVWADGPSQFADLVASATDRERLQLAHELKFCEETRCNVAYFKGKRLRF